MTDYENYGMTYGAQDDQQMAQPMPPPMPNGSVDSGPILAARKRLDSPAPSPSDYESWSPFVWFSLPVVLFAIIAAILYYYGGGKMFGGGGKAIPPPSPLLDE